MVSARADAAAVCRCRRASCLHRGWHRHHHHQQLRSRTLPSRRRRFPHPGRQTRRLAGELAQQAIGDSGKKLRVTASLPPPFGACRPDLFDAAQAPAIARPLVDGQALYADLWLAETQSSTAEVRTLHALAPHDRPFWASFTLDDEHPAKPPRLRSDESIADTVATVIDLSPAAYPALAQTWRAAGADIIGGCCSIGPEHIAALATWCDSKTLPK